MVKVIVKQIGGDVSCDLLPSAAGALTNSTVEAMKTIVDEAAGIDSTLNVSSTKSHGWSYTRKSVAGCKYQVLRSAGKHTNAIMSCMNFFKVHAPLFVLNRLLCLSSSEKVTFFDSLSTLVPDASGWRQLEMVRVSEEAARRMSAESGDEVSKRRLADLILIGINKNGQYISAIGSNYRSGTNPPVGRQSQ